MFLTCDVGRVETLLGRAELAASVLAGIGQARGDRGEELRELAARLASACAAVRAPVTIAARGAT